MASFSFSASAITFEEYIIDHESNEMRAYLTGYADAVHNNAYFIGGCPRKLPYRPYGEYFQHIDIYISKKTKSHSTDLEAFYQESIEPLLTAVILKYINCNNPEARYLSDEPKNIQIEMRRLARNIMNKTKQVQTPQEREKEFAYKQHIDRLNNPEKYKTKHPKCPKQKQCPKITPVSVLTPVSSPISTTIKKEQNSPKQEIKMPDTPLNVKNFPPEKRAEKPPLEIKEQAQQKVVSTSMQETHTHAKNGTSKKIKDTTKHTKKLKQDILLDPTTMPEVKIPQATTKKNVNEVDVVDIKAKTYELDSLEINIDNIDNVTLPSL